MKLFQSSFTPLLLILVTTTTAQVYNPDFINVYTLVSDRIESFGDNLSLARTMVRLAFHDAFGGVDATVDLDDSEHNGLATPVSELDTLWNDNNGGMLAAFSSKADFFAWAYIAAFYFTVNVDLELPFVPLRVGRTTYATARPEDIPPNSEFGSGDQTAVVDYFATTFGMTEREFAIAMGAHTLGGAEVDKSGFVGDWVGNENAFNTAYFDDIQNPPGDNLGWEQVTVPANGKKQWRTGCTTDAGTSNGDGCNRLMLNVDMNLFLDLDPYMAADGTVTIPPEADRPATAPNECGTDGRIWAVCFPERTSDSNTVVETFDNGNQDNNFLAEFATVYDIIISRVTDSATLTAVQETAPATFPGDLNRNNDDDDCWFFSSMLNLWTKATTFVSSP